MSKIKTLIAAAALTGALSANAGLSVQWGFGWGMYNAAATDLTSANPADAVTSSGSVLWQLVYSPDNIRNDVDASGGATGGDIVLDSRTTPTGGAGIYDGFLYDGGSFGSAFETPTYTTGFVYIRVFQDTSPGIGDAYYNSAVLAVSDINLADPLRAPQQFDGNTDSTTQGDKLNLTIVPEPGTFAFLGIGGLLLAVRRMRRS